MIWEANVIYIEKNGVGDDKTASEKKELYLLENYETFSEVEQKLLKEFGAATEIMAIKKSRLKEIANFADEKNKKIFIASLEDVFTDDDTGKQKVTKSNIAFFSSDMTHATAFMDKYIMEGYDMHLSGIKETKFMDVIEYSHDGETSDVETPTYDYKGPTGRSLNLGCSDEQDCGPEQECGPGQKG